MKIFLIAGARPNFMKIAPIVRALKSRSVHGLVWKIVHTGQHYDYEMSQTFFDELEIPEPDFFLEAGSGSHARQTAKIMVAFEKVCQDEKPDIVVVVGDVNSTLACSVVAKKLMIKVAHVEAGLRSFDLSMPEEINRMVTDTLSDYFFVTEKSGIDNLLKEGKPKKKIHFVGHVMIDNLFYQLDRLNNQDPSQLSTYDLKKNLEKYAFLTLHRPSNVDDRATLADIATALNEISAKVPLVFPIHPRTKKMLKSFDIKLSQNIHLLEPLGFRESLFLWKDAIMVMTDSGGLQEETTALGIPCFTIRENTERPITIEEGTNTLVGNSSKGILEAFKKLEQGLQKEGKIPELWDGKASVRIVDVLLNAKEIL
ncbi:MAG: UDP-N-acetylglucosamine 2-epimerase (non-hydrolyzing) [Candidatus Desulfatibia sp.]|uniref:non-hydrolyzing UDP-N-acetylglucosamine 2-epimerase n=1 Tax=Candidatus Desulfatibia sp. TaxID=3101189 RepID=UPI002F2FF56B